METVQNEMHGGQAIPAFDFYLAPYVRKTFEEEIDQISDMENKDYSELKTARIDDYIKRDLIGLQGAERACQHAINRTVGRVHQAMEAFVHNMNTLLHQLRNRHLRGRPLHHPRNPQYDL